MLRKADEMSHGSRADKNQNPEEETEAGSIRDKIRRNLQSHLLSTRVKEKRSGATTPTNLVRKPSQPEQTPVGLKQEEKKPLKPVIVEDPRVTKLKHMKEGMASVFKYYASPETGVLDFSRFKKLVQDTGLLHNQLSVNDLTIVFNQAKRTKDQGLDLKSFFQSLYLLSSILKPDNYNSNHSGPENPMLPEGLSPQQDLINFAKIYIQPLLHKAKKRSNKKPKPPDFDAIYLANQAHKELMVIYKHQWPHEVTGLKMKASQTREEAIQAFGSESYQCMKKFFRQYGLAEVVCLSNIDSLNKLWNQAINSAGSQDHQSEHNSSEHILIDQLVKQNCGFLFRYSCFIQFLQRCSTKILKENITQTLEKMELSSGLKALREKKVVKLSFFKAINAYDKQYADHLEKKRQQQIERE